MPTGYTAGVADGKVRDFPEFAMQCARAFGALVLMRDDPADAPIPDSFEPSPYYRESLEESRTRLEKLSRMTASEILLAAKHHFAQEQKSWRDREDRRASEHARYETMLAKAQAWNPPTPDHVGLKQLSQVDSATDDVTRRAKSGRNRI